jgi:hypothetical protein
VIEPILDNPLPLPGHDRLGATDWANLVATVRTLGQVSGPSLVATLAGCAFRAGAGAWELLPARIENIAPTQYVPPFQYAWREQTWDATNNQWADKPGGRSSDHASAGVYATELAGSLRVGPAVVWMTRAVIDGSEMYLFQAANPTFDARITGATPIAGANYQWQYTFEEVYLAGPGMTGWNTLANGRTSGSDASAGAGGGGTPALNRLEIINSGSPLLGSGVSTANLIGTIAPQPVATGNIVRMDELFAGGGVLAYWCEEPNGLNGNC